MHQFMGAIGRRCSVVNLDPANDHTSYPCALDVRDLVTLEEIMAEDTLGPNGGVLYALEELENNFEWLEKGLKGLEVTNGYDVWTEDYIIFDCPGQVELFTHHSSLRNIFFRISKLGYRLIVIHLVDSYSLTLPSMYISALLLSLRSMLQMDLPHINVLTKIDNLSNYSALPFNLDFYTEVQDLNYLLPHLEAETSRLSHAKFGALNQAIVDLVQEFALVAFETLAVEDKKSMMHLLQVIDRASGYAFGPAEGANDSIWQVAVREGWGDLNIHDVQERWLDAKEEYDEHERRALEEEAKAKQASAQSQDEDELDFQGMIADSGTKVIRKS
ncbi:GPN-loop GTPase 2 [Talaromyces atroroseus]|uniref:GPN-loop GTPase 2 n=1 Tax=Talaromyces atroroseus TaxID=1441469 RepID=A0A225AVJ7_TALAT|nr:GPN-loop GTPase 2 [Talaromyces atroroseus]OKL57507.1 GPN-loop GTPase 2 [Talaromyces atroroseus]